jgi:ABC-type branched-subunit amino acid transport system ATPase component
MIINKFRASNWRRHAKLDLAFHRHTNLIAGPNNAGKSSVLKAIAFLLSPLKGTRLGMAGTDIKAGESVAEVAIEVMLPNRSGADGGTGETHELCRRLSHKSGQNAYYIDGASVSIDEALHRLTHDWGLPHPDQLVGLTWLRQLNLDPLVRESAAARQKRCHDLFGYQALEPLIKLVGKEADRLKATALAERSLGVDATELTVQVTDIEAKLQVLRGEIEQLATPVANADAQKALRVWIAATEAITAVAQIHAAAQALPEPFRQWANARITHRASTPSLGHLSSAHKATVDAAQAQTNVAKLSEELPAGTTWIQIADELRARLNHLEVQAATKDADFAIVRLPASHRDWARELRQELNRGAADPALGPVPPADLLIERNNHRIRLDQQRKAYQAAEALVRKLLGEAPPAEPLRLRLRDKLSADTAMAALVKLHRLPSAGMTAEDLERIAVLLPLAALANVFPTTKAKGADGSRWSNRAEQALAVLWDEMDSATLAVDQCPLTGDTIDPEALAQARQAAADRKAAVLADSHWQNFVRRVVAETAALPADFVTATRNGDLATVQRTVTKAADDLASLRNRFGESADAVVGFAANTANRTTYIRMIEQLRSVTEETRAAAAWLVHGAVARRQSPSQFLETIRSAEMALRQLPPPAPAADEDPSASFDPADGPALRTAERFLRREAEVLRAQTILPGKFAVPLSVLQPEVNHTDGLTAALATVHERIAATEAAARNHAVATQVLAQLTQTQPAAFAPEWAAVRAALPGEPAFASQIRAFTCLALPNATPAAAEWPVAAGPEPASLPVAQARLAQLVQQHSRWHQLDGEIKANEQSRLSLTAQIARTKAREAVVQAMDVHTGRYDFMKDFLSPASGPRVLMGQQFVETTTRANEILESIGAQYLLKADEDFELYEFNPLLPDFTPAASETGGGNGNLSGIALALALLDYYNETSGRTRIDCVMIDEPTICIEKSLVSSLLSTLASNGRRNGTQTFLVEHEPSGEAYCDKVIRL